MPKSPQIQAMTPLPGEPLVQYAYKASLMGAAHRFELTDAGLSWRTGGKSGLWPYAELSAIRLSYRPVSMQSRRFRADIEHRNGGHLVVMSVSWRTAALMAPQDVDYRVFMVGLHARMKEAGSTARLIGGLTPRIYGFAVTLMAFVAIAMAGLFIRAVFIGQFAGMLFLIGFGVLFAWQTGGFVRRNRPRAYTFDDLPSQLLP